MSKSAFRILTDTIESCRLCPRLVEYRENVPAKKQFAGESYWRRPVPGFGDIDAGILLLGLAPSSDGGNRTGRIFTGDLSAKFLMRVLYEMGFSNKPDSISKDDGLQLKNIFITAAVKCVPPQHKPAPSEKQMCSGYLVQELHLLKKLKVVVALGSIAQNAYLGVAKTLGGEDKRVPFKHGGIVRFKFMPTLIASYHPSPQNTNTGVLSADMLKEVFIRANQECL